MYQNKQPLSYSEVLLKITRYCSYQERSMFEVKQKLREYRVSSTDQALILDYLQKENFLSETRFAVAFVRGKVNVKRWGVFKIREGLASKGISGEIADHALHEIDTSIYLKNLETLAEKKVALLGGAESKREKLYRFLLSKGYESELIVQQLKQMNLM